ncbi:ABC transporter permease [Pseudomarimonas arenosa]|uniref:ABC transporter permease n=1 Tax=Pseudomarimonas arenosa TaxID=2774145 RepID=A0AAW3ZI52_9GAMM|nr:ABC transporter permease [Pseudomarimonas arenosa]MBD8525199.1 ABC transporter permease [Pseudomarimonas arenosa]
MWLYYVKLGVISLRRNPVLTVLMVMTLAAGVAASVATLTILNGMSGDPIPHKSERLLVPLIDNQAGDRGNVDRDPPSQLTWRDAEALWTAAAASRQTPLWGLGPSIDPGRKDMPLFFTDGLAVGRDFFAMFETPMIHGSAWSAEDDRRGAQLAVISAALADKLFGAAGDAVGKSIRMDGHDFQVIGVFDRWAPIPKYYRLIGGNYFEGSEDIFIPIRAAINLNLDFNGNINCSSSPEEPGMAGMLKSECVMIQYWVEVDDAAQRRAYADYLEAYVREQKALGRFPRELNNRLFDVREWLDFNRVISDDTRTAFWLSVGFLLVCVINTVSLLLAKFSARPGEIGVRRALGASRAEVFRQYLLEAGVLGLVGSVLGLLFTVTILAFVRHFDRNLELVARIDWLTVGSALLVSVLAALLAGLLPTWRACQVRPALQLKSQ